MSKKNYSLGFVLPGECYEVKKDIINIFDEEFKKACNISRSFQECFKDFKVGAIFKNEKKIGAVISKSKL